MLERRTGQYVMTPGTMRMPLSFAHNSDSLPMVRA